MPSVDQVIVWLVVGLLGGSLAGLPLGTRPPSPTAFP